MSDLQTAWAFGAKVPPLQKLVLIGLTENATHPEDLACILFDDDAPGVECQAARCDMPVPQFVEQRDALRCVGLLLGNIEHLAEWCRMPVPQCRAILAELRAARLIEDGPYPGTIRFMMD